MLIDARIHTQFGMKAVVLSFAAVKLKSNHPINGKFAIVNRNPVKVKRFGAIQRGKN